MAPGLKWPFELAHEPFMKALQGFSKPLSNYRQKSHEALNPKPLTLNPQTLKILTRTQSRPLSPFLGFRFPYKVPLNQQGHPFYS